MTNKKDDWGLRDMAALGIVIFASAGAMHGTWLVCSDLPMVWQVILPLVTFGAFFAFGLWFSSKVKKIICEEKRNDDAVKPRKD